MTKKKNTAEDSAIHPRTTKRTTHNRSKSKTKKPKKAPLVLRLMKWGLILAIWAGIFLTGVLLWFAKDLPDITQTADFQRRSAIIVQASDGSTLARYGELKGNAVSLKDMPPYLPQAVLATEDRRFYEHPGIDIYGIARAMAVNILKGHLVQGGSTITQQLAKNLFLTHDRKFKRKIQEALLALWLEHELTKDEILTAYLNRVYLGSGVYGVSAASRLYFGKDVKDINLQEAAILAGLLKAPSRYSPLNNPELAKERSKTVLAAMVDAGYITEKDVANLKNLPPRPPTKPTGEKSDRYFSDWVIEGLDDLIGTPDMDIIVETTLNPVIQAKAEEVVRGNIDKYRKDRAVTQGAALVMQPDGRILAMVGGYDYGQSQFNRTIQAHRAPGSSFKPVVYLTALRNGATPDTKILDAPITKGDYRPENYAKKYYGEVTLEEALARSLNTVAVRIADKVGIDRVIKTARDLGIISKLQPDLSLALGSSGISMLEMCVAYATIDNGGHRIYPYAISRITTTDGRVLYERKPPTSYTSVVEDKPIEELKAMMHNVVENGTGRHAKISVPAAGKTGTSQDSRDAWFIGFTDRIVAAVWLGNDDNSPMNHVTGGSLPAYMWARIAETAEQHAPEETAFPDSGVNNSNGFSGLLGRLIGSNDNTPHPEDQNDYAHLNN